MSASARKSKAAAPKGAAKAQAKALPPARQRVPAMKAEHASRGQIREGSGLYTSVDRQVELASAQYVATLLEPTACSGGVRVPDLLSYPTATTMLVETASHSINPGECFQLVLTPLVNTSGAGTGTWAYRAAASAGVVFTPWVYVTSANQALMAAAAQYRTVAAGGSAYNTTAALTRTCRAYLSRAHNLGELPNTGAALIGLPSVERVDDFAEGHPDLSWMPIDYETGLDFTPPSNGDMDKGCLVWTFLAGASAQTVEVRVVHHVEFLPGASDAALVPVDSAPGSESDVSRVLSMGLDKFGLKGSIASWIPPDIGTRVADYLWNKVVGGPGGSLGGGMVPKGYYAAAKAAGKRIGRDRPVLNPVGVERAVRHLEARKRREPGGYLAVTAHRH